MRRSPVSPNDDPEFSQNLAPAPRFASSWRPRSHYQRLVVNPFLFVLVEVTLIEIAMSLAAWSERFGLAMGLVGVFGCLIFSKRLFQIHCLDCGRTARLLDWQSHTCSAVEDRAAVNRLPWPRFPDCGVQASLWSLYIFAATVWLLVWKNMPGQSS